MRKVATAAIRGSARKKLNAETIRKTEQMDRSKKRKAGKRRTESKRAKQTKMRRSAREKMKRKTIKTAEKK